MWLPYSAVSWLGPISLLIGEHAGKAHGATEEYARLTLLPSGSRARRIDPKVLPVSSSRGFPFSGSFPSRVSRGLAVQDAAVRILRYPLHAPPTHRRFTVPPLKPA